VGFSGVPDFRPCLYSASVLFLLLTPGSVPGNNTYTGGGVDIVDLFFEGVHFFLSPLTEYDPPQPRFLYTCSVRGCTFEGVHRGCIFFEGAHGEGVHPPFMGVPPPKSPGGF
jgi:hypothetical protein